MRTGSASVGDHCQCKGEDEMTLDGTINVVLVVIAAAVVIYLFVALLDPERF